MATWSDEYYTAHYDELHRCAFRMVYDHEAAHDLVQATFAKAYRLLHEMPEDLHVRGWLFRSLKNRCIDYVRSPAARKCANVDDHAPFLRDTSVVEDTVSYEETKRLIEELLTKLSPEYQRLFDLLVRQEIPLETLANEMGIPKNALKSRMFRARENLRKQYAAAMAS